MSNRDFVEGEQFTIFYGERSNADLLVHNGFTYSLAADKPSPHDTMLLRLGIGKTDPLAQPKFDLLDQLSIPRVGGHFKLTLAEKPFDNILLAFVRINCLTTKDDLEEWIAPTQKNESEGSINVPKEGEIKMDKVRDLLDDKLSSEYESLEKKVYKYLETRCTLLLRCVPTTMEQDLSQLFIDGNEETRTTGVSLNQRNCANLCFKEKLLLQHVVKYCQDIVQAMT